MLWLGAEWQSVVGGGFGAASWCFFEGGVAAVEWVLGLLSVEELLDGQDLQARVAGAVGGFVEAGFGGFFEHWFGGLLEAEEDSDLGFVALDDSAKVADLWDADSSGLNGEDDLAGLTDSSSWVSVRQK
jgi:hypothetical protein